MLLQQQQQQHSLQEQPGPQQQPVRWWEKPKARTLDSSAVTWEDSDESDPPRRSQLLSQSHRTTDTTWTTKTRAEEKRKHAFLWLGFLMLLFFIVTIVLSVAMKNDKLNDHARVKERMDPDLKEKGKTNSDLLGVDMSNSPARRVEIGIYMDKVTDHSIMESGWTADFYLWFRWTSDVKETTTTDHDCSGSSVYDCSDMISTNSTTINDTQNRRSLKEGGKPNSPNNNNGNNNVFSKPQSGYGTPTMESDSGLGTGLGSSGDKEFNPGETFQIIDGELLQKELLEYQIGEPYYPEEEGDAERRLVQEGGNTTANKNGTQQQLHYSLYRVQARLTMFFSITRFPRDDHLKPLRIEDRASDFKELIYVADSEHSKISSRVKIHGYSIPKLETMVKWHAYKSARGNPFLELPKNGTKREQINFSQFVAGVYILRPDWGLYWMMFQGVFASVGVAFLGLVIQAESRFDLGIGGFFACVAATYVSSTQLPMTGNFSLADYIHGFSLCTVLLTLVHIYMASYIFKETKQRWFDYAGLAVFIVGYVSCIAGMSFASSSTW